MLDGIGAAAVGEAIHLAAPVVTAPFVPAIAIPIVVWLTQSEGMRFQSELCGSLPRRKRLPA